MKIRQQIPSGEAMVTYLQNLHNHAYMAQLTTNSACYYQGENYHSEPPSKVASTGSKYEESITQGGTLFMPDISPKKQ